MMAQSVVRMLEGFPDGDTFTIPTIGETVVNTYTEDSAVTYDPLDTAEFQFTIDKYLQSGSYITKKAAQDSFYSAQLEARFVPEQARAIMEHFEVRPLWRLLKLVSQLTQHEAQNGVAHRISGGNGGKLELEDFAYARYRIEES